MKFKYIRSWWRLYSMKRECRAWVRHEGVKVAAKAMFELNRYARQLGRGGFQHKNVIYSVKNLFIELLYQQGYCVSLTRHKQELKCHNCGGTGIDSWNDDDFCERCNGSGVYRTNYLAVFSFNIDGTLYTWHQPEQLVRFDHDYTDNVIAPFQVKELDDWRMLTRQEAELKTMTVYAYLLENHIAVPDFNLINFESALYLDFHIGEIEHFIKFKILKGFSLRDLIAIVITDLTCLFTGHVAETVDYDHSKGGIFCYRCGRYVEHVKLVDPGSVQQTKIHPEIDLDGELPF